MQQKSTILTPDQEVEFRHKLADTHVFFRRTGMLIAFFAYAIFAVSDPYVVPASADALLLYRFAVVCPVLLLFFTYSFTHQYKQASQNLVVVQCVVLGYLHLGLMSLLNTSDAGYSSYYGGLILIICGFGAFAGLTASSCIFACVSILAGYQATAILGQDILSSTSSQGIFIINNLFLITAVAISATVSHLLETYKRREYIHELALNRALLSLKESKEKLKIAYDDQLGWSKMLTRFLRHELGNQLNGVSTSLQMIERTDIEQKVAKYVARGNQSVTQLQTLLVRASEATGIDEVLAVTQKSTIDIVELLEELVHEYNQCLEHKIVMTTHASLLIEGNALLINQLFRNLIDNATRYAAHSTQVIVVVTSSNEIVIENEGEPLPENLESLFVLGNSNTSGFGHFGMGLYVAKKVVDAHDGSIKAESLEGDNGARFKVKLSPAISDEIISVR